MKLIDSDKFKAKLLSLMDRKSPVPSDTDCILDGILNLLEEQPEETTEKHGHWIIRNSIGSASCSACGGTIYNAYENNANRYCHCCGAKMDENNNKNHTKTK